MDERPDLRDAELHRIEEDLDGAWLDELAASGTAALERFLAKHLAFLSYLDDAA